MARPKKKAPPRTRKKGSTLADLFAAEARAEAKAERDRRAVAERGVIRRPSAGSTSKNPVIERREVDGVIYQLEMVKCGKKTCKRDALGGHGPYWYAYQLSRRGGGLADAGGRWVSKYIGREFREI